VKFREIVEQYELLPCQVYNIDETGLNYKMIPKKILASSNDTMEGTKHIKDRLTIASCSNADGTHKLPLFVIGKKHRTFKNINLTSLPVYYRNQKSAWMDCNLFKSWFIDDFVQSVEKDLNQKKLPVRVILLLDNAPSHPSEEELVKVDIKAIFLPPNVITYPTNGSESYRMVKEAVSQKVHQFTFRKVRRRF